MTTLDESLTGAGQSRDYTRIVSVGTARYRVKMHRDSSYDVQSHAQVEYWTPAGWTQVLALHGTDARMTALPTIYTAEKVIDGGLTEYYKLGEDLLAIAQRVTA